jgi:hypothetical protein
MVFAGITPYKGTTLYACMGDGLFGLQKDTKRNVNKVPTISLSLNFNLSLLIIRFTKSQTF